MPLLKKLTITRANPLVRLPAILFKTIDKRKKKIPLMVTYDNSVFVVEIDKEKL